MPKGGVFTGPMKVSPELAAIIGLKEASRAQCMKHLWAYLKEHNLQDPENNQFFRPDEKLAKVFSTERISAFEVLKLKYLSVRIQNFNLLRARGSNLTLSENFVCFPKTDLKLWVVASFKSFSDAIFSYQVRQ